MAVSRRTVTVLFADVADSTPLGERLDAETLRQVMTRYFDCVRGVLERHGGTIEKFIGDAVMAVFGIPELHEDDALRAVRAATELRVALAELNEQLDRAVGVRIGMRVGANTGEVVAGDGTGGQMLVTGDPVNVAKRLEETARTGEILVGETTRRLVENAAVLEPREEVTLKGKTEPIVAWNVLAVIEGAPAYARRLDAPLVGREAELQTLRDGYAKVVSERSCRLITIVGPAGIGKSRLASELCVGVRDAARVLTGPCLPYGDGITFWPLTRIVGVLGSDEGVHELLAGVEDGELIADRVLGAVGPSPTIAAGGEMFWAVRRLFEELARDQPVVIVIDDIQWAEPKLLDLLEYLAGGMDDAPVLLLCLARPDLLDERPDWLTPQKGGSLLLGPLTEAESEALLEEIAREWPLDSAARARIAEAAEGNPLYVEQMAAMLAEGGTLEVIPPSIHALIAARLDRLPAGERSVIERAAVAGKDFTRRAVLELSPEDEHAEVDERLLSLVRKDLLATRPGREDAYRFRHVLIKDAAYAGIPKELRAQLHQRFADWAARTNAGRAGDLDEIIGYHLEQAFRYRDQLAPLDATALKLAQRAADLLGAAGQRAYARDDIQAAVNLLDRALALLTEQDPAKVELERELSGALWSTGEIARAEALLNGVIEVASASGDRRLEWYAILERSGRRSLADPSAATEDGLSVAKEAVEIFGELGDDRGLARAWREIYSAHQELCQFADAEDASAKALEFARRAGDGREESRSADALCTCLLYGPTPADEAIRRCETLLARASGKPLLEANVLTAFAGLKGMRAEFGDARRAFKRADRIYSDLGLRLAVAGLTQVAGPLELLAGDPEAAEHVLRRGYEILEPVPRARSYQAVLLAEVLHAQGRADEARDLISGIDNSGLGGLIGRVLWRIVSSRLVAETAIARSLELAEAAVAMVARTDALNLRADALTTLGEFLRVAGRADEALDRLREARRLYERKGNLARLHQVDPLVADRVTSPT